MNNEEEPNPLAEFDLSTWDAPAPPADLAEAVIASVAQPVGAPAIEPSERPHRWWIAASLAAVVASASVVALIVARGEHHAGADHGEVVATRAQHVDLDTIEADLDAGAAVTWKRDRDGLVAQQRGTVTWRVADDDKLRIDTGATLATVEASGASLRVEAHMNLSDARVIGASAVTAAAVAFVTVIVYRGHVASGTAGQTVVVEPGATVELRPNQPPAPDLVGASDPRIRDLQAQLKQAQDHNTALREQAIGANSPLEYHCDVADADMGRIFMTDGRFEDALAGFESSLRCSPDDPSIEKLALLAACEAQDLPKAKLHFARLLPDVQTSVLESCLRKRIDPRPADGMQLPIELDRSMISAGVASVHDRVMACGDRSPARGKVELHVRVVSDGEVHLVWVKSSPDEGLGKCAADAMQAASFANTRQGGAFDQTFVFTGSTSSAAGCDAAELAEQGKQNISVGAFAAALANFEDSLRCKRDLNVTKLAYMAACRAANVAKAKQYYAALPESSQDSLIQLCLGNRIDPTQDATPSQASTDCNPFSSMKGCGTGGHAVPACDATDLVDKGKANLAVSAFATALTNFELALRCKADHQVEGLAFLAACRGSNAPKATHYWARLTAADQSSLLQVCLANKIDPRPAKP